MLVQKKLQIQNIINVQSGGTPLKLKVSGKNINEMMQNALMAQMLRNLMPNFMTSFAFIIDATPSARALIAK